MAVLRITVNGKPREIEPPCTLREFLRRHEINPAVVAVERNSDIVKRDTYDLVMLGEGDVLEIVHMVGGGA